jgi:hypothetical protein
MRFAGIHLFFAKVTGLFAACRSLSPLYLPPDISPMYNFVSTEFRSRANMKKLFVGLLALITAMTFNASANADWKFESDNKPSGLTAYASSYWINGIGPVNYYGLANSELEYETYYAALMIQCTKKKYTVSMSLMQTGSAHENMSLDDPGFISLQFQSLKGTKKATYATYGFGVEGTLFINSNTQSLISNISQSRTMKVLFKKRSGKSFSATFDTRDLALGKKRFAYAGCKI